MGLVKIVGGFLALWILFYLVVYLSYLAPDETVSEAVSNADITDKSDTARQLNLKTLDTPFARHPDDALDTKSKHGFVVKNDYVDYFEPAISTNPFLSTTCIFRTEQARDLLTNGDVSMRKSVGVVIPVRNENKNEVLKTVESIIKNSGNELQRIIIVDDFSTTAVDLWPEWAAYYAGANDRFGSRTGEVLQILRLHHRNGVAKAKAFGAEHMRMDKIDVLVFVDAHVIVSKDWLIPLTTELNKHPQSIVYPAIDIIDGSSGDLIKSENAVGAFDWSLGFRWEILNPTQIPMMKSRLPLSATDKDGHAISGDDVVSSPAAPGMLAITARHYHDIGGFDTSLFPWGQESVELSIRVWLCGGSVLRQPCSRVAHTYRHLYHDVSVNNGVTQEQIDRNVLSVAELWLSPHQRETVYQSRFTGRIPYNVETSLDVRQLKEFLSVQVLREEKCQSFDWFLSEIYPGLELDRASVEVAYKNHLSSQYLEEGLAPLVEQYDKAQSSVVVDHAEIALLRKRENTIEEITVKGNKRKAVPPIIKEVLPTPAELHQLRVKDTLECMDQPKKSLTDAQTPCEMILEDSPDACRGQKPTMMFTCPHTCNMCGEDGKICFDFYEHKCPEWKALGQCESSAEEMATTCRMTCGFCSHKDVVVPVTTKLVHGDSAPRGLEVVPAEDAVQEPPINHNLPPAQPALSAAEQQAAAAQALITTSYVVNPFVAQEQYKSGLLPDPPVGLYGACALNDKPHGKLLAYMTLAAVDESLKVPRILCGIYTMEKNHKGNVQATRETWGKKCDGFIAFSTVTDDTIPSVNILHEGDEHYDNMWQKSRSIWKYIAAHYVDSFDYFLLGGDDMFYVVENLKHYLMSDEISKYAAQNNGVFLGRRFWPADQKVFNSGGAGYILDRKALRTMSPFLDSPKCYAHQRGFWEDVNVAHCLKVAGGIEPYDTRDELDRERFHPFTPGQHLEYRIPLTQGDWYPKYNPFLKEGFDCCSPESVSFHYCAGDLTKDLFNYFYNCHDKHKAI